MSLLASLSASLFGAAVRVRNGAYDRGMAKPKRLRGPVISVGNISVGGTGKTPFVIALGELLLKRGVKFNVLSRGYGRSSKTVAVVDPLGPPVEFGDEPLLIARKLKVPVIVAAERYDAGRLAEEKFGAQLHLLDDGFQHRHLARDFDVVLLTPDDVRDTLLPAGRLREPLTAIRRADAIVLTSGASADALPPELLAGKLVWRVRRGIVPRNVSARPLAFCGIARPESFFLQLRKAEIEPAAEAAFRDHHRYSATDIRDLLTLAQRAEADGFVTTEKDLINLGPLASQLRPTAAVPVRMQLDNADAVLDAMLRTIELRQHS